MFKQWRGSIATILMIVLALGSALTTTGCNKEKALKSVRQADELAAKLLIYGRNIAKANNDSFEAGNIPATAHLTTNRVAEGYLKGVNIFLAGIATAKRAIEAGGDATNQLDILEAIFEREVVSAATALSSLVATLPPGLADRIGGWAAAIQLALFSFRALIADARTNLQEVPINGNA